MPERFRSTVNERAAHLSEFLRDADARYSDNEPAAYYQLIQLFQDAVSRFGALYTSEMDDLIASVEHMPASAEVTVGADAAVRQSKALLSMTASAVLRDLSRLIDNTLTRRAQYAPDAALHAVMSRELETIGLSEMSVLVVVGDSSQPPCTVQDVQKHLADILAPLEARVANDERGSRPVLHIISLPFPYTSSAPWHAVVVGHELAHLHFTDESAAVYGLGQKPWWLDEGEWLGDRFPTVCADIGVGTGHGRLILSKWLKEILCDSRAVSLYGPAGYAGIVECIATSGHPASSTSEYPSLAFRARLMWKKLQDTGHDPERHEFLVPPSQMDSVGWNNVLAPGDYTRLERYIEYRQSVLDRLVLDSLHGAAENVDRSSVIEAAVKDLESGVPVELATYRGVSSDLLRISEPDLINAWVVARGKHPEQVEFAELLQKSLSDLALVREWQVKTEGTPQEGLRFGVRSHVKRPAIPRSRPPADSTSAPVGTRHIECGQLSGPAITARLEMDGADRLIVTPLIDGAVREAGIDLRLSTDFILMQRSAARGFDPLQRRDTRSFQSRVSRPWGGKFVLHPNETVLASALEYIKLPGDLAGRVTTRSSYGRLGLVCATATSVNPWFRGCLTLELVNLGVMPLILTPGARVAQLTLFRVAPQAVAPRRPKFSGPIGPVFASPHDDEEIDLLTRLAPPERERVHYHESDGAAAR